MTTEFSPKSNYQGFHTDCADELQKQSDKRWFTVSIAYALAQLAHSGATTDEMAGARRFIQILRALPDTTPERPAFPKRELTAFENQETKP